MRMTRARNTKSAKAETQKAQTESGFFFALLVWVLCFLCSKDLNSMPFAGAG
jgi:hypothetical protein